MTNRLEHIAHLVMAATELQEFRDEVWQWMGGIHRTKNDEKVFREFLNEKWRQLEKLERLFKSSIQEELILEMHKIIVDLTEENHNLKREAGNHEDLRV